MVKRFNPEFRVGQGGILEVSADRDLPTDAFLVLVDASAGPVTITLLRADGWGGKRFCIKKVDSSVNVVTVVPVAGQTIDGQTSVELAVLEQAIELLSDNENYVSVGVGTGPTISLVKSFLLATLSVVQSTTVIGTPVEFNTVVTSRGSNITLNAGTKRFTLKAGKTYKCMASMFVTIAGELASIWRDFTNSINFGVSGTSVIATALIANSNQNVVVGYISPSTDIEVFVNIDFINGLADINNTRTWAKIEEF